jgi:hypothetical protein
MIASGNILFSEWEITDEIYFQNFSTYLGDNIVLGLRFNLCPEFS